MWDFIKTLFLTPQETEGKAVNIITYFISRVGGILAVPLSGWLAYLAWPALGIGQKMAIVILLSVWVIVWILALLVGASYSKELKKKREEELRAFQTYKENRRDECEAVFDAWRNLLRVLNEQLVWSKLNPAVQPDEVAKLESMFRTLRYAMGVRQEDPPIHVEDWSDNQPKEIF